MVVNQKKTSKKLDTSKITTNLKSTFYVDKEIQDTMKKYYQIKNLIIQHHFLEDGKRYGAELFKVYLTFNGLSNDISHIVVG